LQAIEPPDTNRLDPSFERGVLVVAGLSCIALAFLVYWPVIDDYFVWDDFFFLRAVRINDFWHTAQEAFTFPEPRPFDEVTLFWRPLLDFYFFASKPLGIHPQPYHILNIVLHGLAGMLAILLLYRLSQSLVGAIAAGLLFIVAPTYDIAVSWIAQVSEIVGLVLVLTALLTYHAYLRADRPRRLLLATTAALTVLALLSKESTVILAVLLPGLVFATAPSQLDRSRRQLTTSLAIPLLLIVAFGLVMQLRETFGPDSLHSLGLHMARNLWRYLEWIVVPYPAELRPLRETLAALFLVAGVATIVMRQRALAFFFVWTIAALMPYVGFDEWTEWRYTYLATLPFAAFVVLGTVALIDRLPRAGARLAYGVFGAAVLAALIVAPMRTRDQQAYLSSQAAAYEAMIDAVHNTCGEVPRDSHVFILDAPYLDLWGIHTPAALNLFYDHVNAAAVQDMPPLIGFIEQKCVLQYDAATGTYQRVSVD
jgi:hypothetical protein